jgi:hypothetical protein
VGTGGGGGGGGGGGSLQTIPEPPTPSEEEAWRRELWAAARRGDSPPPWRSSVHPPRTHHTPPDGIQYRRESTQQAGDDEAAALSSASSVHGGEDAGAPPQPRPVALLVVPSLVVARELRVLYSALSSPSSRYEPRLLISPEVAVNGGGCRAVAAAMGALAMPAAACGRADAAYELRGNYDDVRPEWSVHADGTAIDADSSASGGAAGGGGGGIRWRAAAAAAEAAGACGALLVEVEEVLRSSSPAFVVLPSAPAAPGGEEDGAACEAAQQAAADDAGGDGEAGEAGAGGGGIPHGQYDGAGSEADAAFALAVRDSVELFGGLPLLTPPPSELALLEWVAVMPPSAMAQWHTPSIDISVITHRRPESLSRLLHSLRCAHLLGDQLDLTFSLEAGSDNETVRLARTWAWPHGARHAYRREVKGGLIAAVVESWTPSTDHSYGVLLEDDIEVSPHFYVYAKLLLLRHVYASAADGGGGGVAPKSLLGISLYTPRLVELTMPRRKIDLYGLLGPHRPSRHAGAGGLGHLFLQQLPCSWGQVFFPGPWMDFRRYMRRRLHESAPAVVIPRSACCPGWSTSWKKFLIELSFLRGYVVVYPNFANQSSLSTNHLEPGEHIKGKANKLKHKPIDFTVPLLHNPSELRYLWTALSSADSAASAPLAPLAPLHALPTLDLFSDISSLDALVARGLSAVDARPELARVLDAEAPGAGEGA